MSSMKLKAKFDHIYFNNCTLASPQQQPDAYKLQTAADTYEQVFIKHPRLSFFHSLSEFYHAVLLESDKSVSCFVPQPYSMKIGSRRYIPDCFYVKGKERFVVEIKPRGEFKKELLIPLQDYFTSVDMQFIVVSNEDILAKETKVLNWLYVIRTLLSCQNIQTEQEELKIYENFSINNNPTYGDLIYYGNRLNKFKYELALFKMIYRGEVIVPDFDRKRICYDMTAYLCN